MSPARCNQFVYTLCIHSESFTYHSYSYCSSIFTFPDIHQCSTIFRFHHNIPLFQHEERRCIWRRSETSINRTSANLYGLSNDSAVLCRAPFSRAKVRPMEGEGMMNRLRMIETSTDRLFKYLTVSVCYHAIDQACHILWNPGTAFLWNTSTCRKWPSGQVLNRSVQMLGFGKGHCTVGCWPQGHIHHNLLNVSLKSEDHRRASNGWHEFVVCNSCRSRGADFLSSSWWFQAGNGSVGTSDTPDSNA